AGPPVPVPTPAQIGARERPPRVVPPRQDRPAGRRRGTPWARYSFSPGARDLSRSPDAGRASRPYATRVPVWRGKRRPGRAPGDHTGRCSRSTPGHRAEEARSMDTRELARRTLMRQGSAALAALALLRFPELAQAFPSQPGEVVVPWLDQPPPAP